MIAERSILKNFPVTVSSGEFVIRILPIYGLNGWPDCSLYGIKKLRQTYFPERRNDSGLMSRTAKNRSELDALKDWFDYNTYVRKIYLKYLSTLPEETLTKDRGASFPSILDIFWHVLDVYNSWIYRYRTGERMPAMEPSYHSLEEVQAFEKKTDSCIAQFIGRTTSSDLNRTLQFEIQVEGRKVKRKLELREMLWHLVEEELQHRGELNALLWQTDLDPPVLSWGKWLRDTKRR
jgi:uncharacterized damage-inducible protein DinB